MSISKQAAELKAFLLQVGATKNGEDKLSVSTRSVMVGKDVEGKAMYENYEATCHTDNLSDSQIEKLRILSPCIKIDEYQEYGFAIVSSH